MPDQPTQYSDYAAAALRMVGSDSRLTSTLQEDAVRSALGRYSSDFPYARVTGSLAGLGYSYVLAPSGWSVGQSDLMFFETPVAATTADPRLNWLAADEVHKEVASDGTEIIRLRGHTLATTDSYRVGFTTPHTIKGLKSNVGDAAAATSTTIPKAHDPAFTPLCAHVMADQLANLTASAVDSSLDGDYSDQGAQHNRWDTTAARLLKRYRTMLKLDDEDDGPIGAFVSWSEQTVPLLFSRVVVLSRTDPSASAYAPFVRAL